MCIAPDKDDAKRQPLQSHYCDGLRLGLCPLVKTRSPTCRDHVEKQTQKSREPCSGKCVAVTQRPHAISGAVGMPPFVHCRTGCERHGGIHDEQGFETRCRDDKTVTSMLLGGPKGAREIPAPQGLFAQDASRAGIAGGARTPVLHTGDQKKLAKNRAPPDVGTADAKYHHRQQEAFSHGHATS